MLTQNIREQLQMLPAFFAHHLGLSLLALVIGVSISLPLGVVLSRYKRLEPLAMGLAGTVQTIPSLALLALMVPLLGMIGFWPALIALVLYSILPVLRNTLAGLASIDPAMIEAADGLGMSNWQKLMRVELPLAAPTIVAGIRTALVWVVGIATLATPVGQTTLGNFIFTGLQTQNQAAVIIGCVAAAGLAMLLDSIVRVTEVAVRRQNRRLMVGGIASFVVFALVGLAPMLQGGERRGMQTVVVGAKTFTEQHVLAELLAKQFRRSGFGVISKPGLGSQIAFDALKSDSIDCYVDYTGTIWTNVMKRTDFPPRRQMLVEIKRYLATNYGIISVGRLGFENAYALAIPKSLAEQFDIRTISDLVAHAPKMRLGGDVEFFGRPEWQQVRDRYGLNFQKTVGMDSSLMYDAVKTGELDAIAAFSSDGRIAAFDLQVLQDDRNVFPPYDAIVLVSKGAAGKPNIFRSLQPLLESVDDDMMRLTNKLVDVDGMSPQEAATVLIRQLDAGGGQANPEFLLTTTGTTGDRDGATAQPVIEPKSKPEPRHSSPPLEMPSGPSSQSYPSGRVPSVG